jgi:hypothetical protein
MTPTSKELKDKISLDEYITELKELSKYKLTILDKQKRLKVKGLIVDLIIQLTEINK